MNTKKSCIPQKEGNEATKTANFLVDYAQWTLVYFERIRAGCRA